MKRPQRGRERGGEGGEGGPVGCNFPPVFGMTLSGPVGFRAPVSAVWWCCGVCGKEGCGGGGGVGGGSD